VEGTKLTPEIAAIRRVPVHRSIDSPNRFDMFACPDDGLDWVARMRSEVGRSVGLKIVVGGPGGADELVSAMARRGDGPDWITVDGGEGGSGASYRDAFGRVYSSADLFPRGDSRDAVGGIAGNEPQAAGRHPRG
jgi:glutamate synthase domain-containing protein 2